MLIKRWLDKLIGIILRLGLGICPRNQLHHEHQHQQSHGKGKEDQPGFQDSHGHSGVQNDNQIHDADDEENVDRVIRRQLYREEGIPRRRRRHDFASWSMSNDECREAYTDLCRTRMQLRSPSTEAAAAAAGDDETTADQDELRAKVKRGQMKNGGESAGSNDSTSSNGAKNSASSWCEESIPNNMDITTGHAVLSYMEEHLENKDKLSDEWSLLCEYLPDPASTDVAQLAVNHRKNRYVDILPYDHCRVKLDGGKKSGGGATPGTTGSGGSSDTTDTGGGGDYVNASLITDHDPRFPTYIATQGPLLHTVADFWQLVWENRSNTIVMLTSLEEGGLPMSARYWPTEGNELYDVFEVHLISEHVWSEQYLVRSFYLKNINTGETRTVSQFHFVTWRALNVPPSTQHLLEFRRKVNKSFHGSSPIIVHCNDGSGRTGTYCLIDMVLNRIIKGAKEIDMAATLEHIRDQRPQMVRTQEQFEFALRCVADEVHTLLKAMNH